MLRISKSFPDILLNKSLYTTQFKQYLIGCTIMTGFYWGLSKCNDRNWEGKYHNLGGCQDHDPERPVKFVWSVSSKIVNQPTYRSLEHTAMVVWEFAPTVTIWSEIWQASVKHYFEGISCQWDLNAAIMRSLMSVVNSSFIKGASLAPHGSTTARH